MSARWSMLTSTCGFREVPLLGRGRVSVTYTGSGARLRRVLGDPQRGEFAYDEERDVVILSTEDINALISVKQSGTRK